MDKQEAFHIIPGDGAFQKAKYDLIQKYHTDQAVDFIIKGENYYEVICFSFRVGHLDAMNDIVNNLDILKQFALSFKEQAAHLLNRAENSKIILPEHMIGLDFKKITRASASCKEISEQQNPLKTLEIQYPGKEQFFDYGRVVFSYREAQCLHYFLHHYSAQKTSEKVFISKKTVEFHLSRIKEKLSCHDSSQITKLAVDYGFIDLLFMKF